MSAERSKSAGSPSRRDFLKQTALSSAAALVSSAALTGCASQTRGAGPGSAAPGVAPAAIRKLPDRIRVGVIGAGGRGTGAAWDCLSADSATEIVAVGDLLRERVDSCVNSLREEAGKAGCPERVKITPERCFSGFDNYKAVLASDVDLVILATPPGFRPIHFKAAIEAGKHVFMEKPVAVDPTGVRTVIAAAELASQTGLNVVCGTQRRHQPCYLEVMKRIHDGQIGEIVAAQCYWNQEGLWVKQREAGWSEMEWQCRNWLYFTWLSGDHIVEQHVHNLDAVNWALQSTPLKAVGMGGRQQRTAAEYGNIYDHFAVEYEYPNGVRTLSMCRQIPGTSVRVAERIVGTKGVARMDGGNAEITGSKPWKFDDGGKPVNPYVQEHADLIASIRAGQPLNEGRRIAESTLTAIMGRMSAYTGRELQWNWAINASKLDLMPRSFAMGDNPVDPVAIPGVTKLV